MMQKEFASRIIHKHDIETNWNKATNFIPKQGEIIVYDIDDLHDYERIKIGDGVTEVTELPFYQENVAYINASDNETITNPEVESSSISVDSYLSNTSTNPVQNKVVTAELSTLSEQKLSKSFITQKAGASESLVMSQKAVTDLVANALGGGSVSKYTNLFNEFGNGFDNQDTKFYTNWLPYNGDDNGGTGTIYHFKGVNTGQPYKMNFAYDETGTGATAQFYCTNASVQPPTAADYDSSVIIVQHHTPEYTHVRFEIREALPENLIITANENIVESGGSTEYETVDSVDEMTDTTKQYVLKSTGTIWSYTETEVDVKHNAYDKATAKFNYRINSSGSEVAYKGAVLTDYIEVDYADNYPVTISGVEHLVLNYSSYVYVDYYDSNKSRLGHATSAQLGIAQTSGILYLPLTFNLFNPNGYESTKYVRIKVGINDNIASLSSSDVEGLVINFEPKNTTEMVGEWYDTGLTPSNVGGSGNFIDILVKVNQNSTDIAEIDRRVKAVEAGGTSLTIPAWWEDAVAACVSKIKALQVGKHCVTFPFFSDNHQRNGYSGVLIAKIMQECNIPYCFFGGDSISSGYIANEATMIEQDKKFDEMMSYIPNGRLCRAVGNHDGFWNETSATGDEYHYTREQVYELFMREESVAQNKHYGEDGTYYYVDDLASKTRWIVLNTNTPGTGGGGSVDAVQLAWLQDTALSFNENGWGVVVISHQPISNHYHAGISNAAEVRTVMANYINGSNANKADIIGWYSGHIHRDRIYTGAAVNTSDDSQGADMGFKQVTITSDHTSISYEDATKHAVANDDQSHAIDFVTINKSTRTVNLTRLGVGSDRSYTY